MTQFNIVIYGKSPGTAAWVCPVDGWAAATRWILRWIRANGVSNINAIWIDRWTQKDGAAIQGKCPIPGMVKPK